MTRRIAIALMATFLLALLVPATSPAAAGRYIVVLQDGASDPGEVATRHARQYGASVSRVYRHALRGYAATLSDERVDDVRNDPEVSYVERDQVARAVAQTVPWGITKIGANLSSTKAGDGTGAVTNVRAYVIDTGIDRSHSDLNVANHVNFAGGKNNDCNGHGTHVAGTVGARDNTIDVVGVAPGLALTGVKVLGCSGSGSYSKVIAGVDWVTKNAVKPAAANMSLGGPVSKALDDAVRNSAASGVFYAIAAGNDGASACNYSPARAGTTNGIATVAATNSSDGEASWSNYGSCVDIWAPGVSILSTRRGGGTTTMSGTSMASPHVAGGGALYLASHTADGPATVESALKSTATITGTKSKDGRAVIREYVGGF
jgi:subtilisin family serine protease